VKSVKPLFIAAFCLLFSLTGTTYAKPPAKKAEPTEKAEERAEETLPIEELRAFAEIFSRVKNDYVEKVSDKVLLEHAISGMVQGLDPHSSYLNNEEYQELQEGTSGVFGGLGIEVGLEDGFVKVIIDEADHQLLGVAIVGPEASDLISESALALEMCAFAEDVALTVHPHPTLGEGVMEAFKHSIGEAIHIKNR